MDEGDSAVEGVVDNWDVDEGDIDIIVDFDTGVDYLVDTCIGSLLTVMSCVVERKDMIQESFCFRKDVVLI